MTSILPQLLVMFLGGVVISLLTPTALASMPRRWWQVVAVVSILSVCVNLLFGLIEARKPENNLLIRDVVAWVFLAGSVPLLIAAVSRGVARHTNGVWPRTGAAVLTLAILAGSSPFIMLLVHCSSGDCL